MKKRILLSLFVLFLNYPALGSRVHTSFYFENDGKTFSSVSSYKENDRTFVSVGKQGCSTEHSALSGKFVNGTHSFTNWEIERMEKNSSKSYRSILHMLDQIQEKMKAEDSPHYRFYVDKEEAFNFWGSLLSVGAVDKRKNYYKTSFSKLYSYVKKQARKAKAAEDPSVLDKPRKVNPFPRKKISNRVVEIVAKRVKEGAKKVVKKVSRFVSRKKSNHPPRRSNSPRPVTVLIED